MTDGFEVFVQLVIDAISTAPSCRSKLSPSRLTSTARPALTPASSRLATKVCAAALSEMRSCGRLGPEMLGSTEPRSSSSMSV